MDLNNRLSFFEQFYIEMDTNAQKRQVLSDKARHLNIKIPELFSLNIPLFDFSLCDKTKEKDALDLALDELESAKFYLFIHTRGT
jgi:hypothetical protein